MHNKINITCLGGSAKGLNNNNSKSGYNKMIMRKINHKHEKLIFLFGSVDVDFVYTLKFLKDPNIDYVNFNLLSINGYLKFLTSFASDKIIIVLSVGLPTLDNDNLKRITSRKIYEYTNDKNEIKLTKQKIKNDILPNIYERTKITINFNEQLKEEITKLNNKNIHFLDVTSFTYDDELKRIKNIYYTKKDHHNYSRNIKISQKLNAFIKNVI